MRKIFMALLMACSFTMHAETAEVIVKGIKYSVDTSAKVAKVSEIPSITESGDTLKDAYIENTVDYNGVAYKVTEVLPFASSQNPTITSVRIGWNINTIGSHAFAECPNLRTVNLKYCSNVRYVNEYAFSKCPELQSFEPEKCAFLHFGDRAFEYCTNLVYVHYQWMLSCGDAVFQGCESLQCVQCRNLLLSAELFDGCKSLYLLEYDDEEVLDLHRNCVRTFRNCERLKSLTFKTGGIPAQTFSGCTSLEEVEIIPDSICKYIGTESFYNCTSLISLYIPQGTEWIYDRAFMKSGLQFVDIPKEVRGINGQAFADCEMLCIVKVHWDDRNYYIPTIKKSVFSNYEETSLYVPDDYYVDYLYVDVWKDFRCRYGFDDRDNATNGINSVSVTNDKSAYNLNGVKTSGKGIVIKNGKKYIAK